MTIFYVSFSSLSGSVNAVYINGLRANGVFVETCQLTQKGLRGYFEARRAYRRASNRVDLVMVGYEGSLLTVWMRIIARRRIVFNALCSMYERRILSRGLAARRSPKSLWYWIIDWLAVRSADLVMLETEQQVNYFKKLFDGGDAKYVRAFTGVNDAVFAFDPSVQKERKFTVVFRGMLVPEAGIEYLLEAAKLLEGEPIMFRCMVHGIGLPAFQKRLADLDLENIELTTDFLDDATLRRMLQSAHLSIGQLSAHERLLRTIPHKAYESLALKLPYLTASNPGALELFTPGTTCIVCKPADSHSLAEQIRWAFHHQEELAVIGEHGYELYQTRLTGTALARTLLTRL